MRTNEQAATGEKVVTDCKLKQSTKMPQFTLGTSLICEHLCMVFQTVLTQCLAVLCALGADFVSAAQALLQELRVRSSEEKSRYERTATLRPELDLNSWNQLFPGQQALRSAEMTAVQWECHRELNKGKELSSTNSSPVWFKFQNSFFCTLRSSYSSMPLLLSISSKLLLLNVCMFLELYVPNACVPSSVIKNMPPRSF